MSELGQAIDQYLALRRSLGFELREPETVLRRFVAFAEREGAVYITTDLVLRWTSEPSKAPRGSFPIGSVANPRTSTATTRSNGSFGQPPNCLLPTACVRSPTPPTSASLPRRGCG
jgi:hypothetical protein